MFSVIKKKLLKKFVSAGFAFSLVFSSSVSYANTDMIGMMGAMGGMGGIGGMSGGMDASQIANMVMGMGGYGIPLLGSKNASYTYVSKLGMDKYNVICLPLDKYARNPTVNETGRVICKGFFMKGVKGKSGMPGLAEISPDKGGKNTSNLMLRYSYVSGQDNDGNDIWEDGYAIVTLAYNAYQGSTNLGGDQFGTSAGETPWNPVTPDDIGSPITPGTGGGNGGDVRQDPLTRPDSSGGNGGGGNGGSGGKGSALCPDGQYFCDPETGTDLWGNGGKGNGGGTSGGGSTDGGVTPGGDGTSGKDGGNGTSGKNGGSGTSGKDGTSGTDGSNGKNWGRVLDDLLKDRNTYNSGGNDWAKSNNGDNGDSNLDNYFNGVGDGDSLPGGLTNDVLGVGDLLDQAQQSDDNLVDTDGDGVADSFYNDEGEVRPLSEYQGGGDYYGGDISNNSGGGDDDASFWDSLSSLTNGLDGLTGDLNGLVGNDDSLLGKIRSLMSDSDSANASNGATEQELFDIAKKILMANGMSLEDIRKGKNYDKNSAYTEPDYAWDMNRITRLLQNKKIDLNHNEVKKAETKNTVTGAADKGKEIKNTNKKQ